MSTIASLKKKEVKDAGAVVLPGVTKYIDGVNGSDENSGYTSNDAWKTLNHAIEWYNSVYKFNSDPIEFVLMDTATTYSITESLSINGGNLLIMVSPKGSTVKIERANTSVSVLLDIFNSKVVLEDVRLSCTDDTLAVRVKNSYLYLDNSGGVNMNSGSKFLDVEDSYIVSRGLSVVYESGDDTITCKSSTLDLQDTTIRSANGSCITLYNSNVIHEGTLDLITDAYGINMVTGSNAYLDAVSVDRYNLECMTGIGVYNDSSLNVSNGEGGILTLNNCETGVDVYNGRASIDSLTVDNISYTCLYASYGSYITVSNAADVGAGVSLFADPTESTSDTPQWGNVGSWIYADTSGGGGAV